MDDQIIKLVYQSDTTAVDRIRESTKGLKGDTDHVAAATDTASRSTSNFGRTAMETSRALQDFSQGGIGGVLNNIEGLSVAIGGGAGLAGILTILGVAAFALKDQFKNLAAGFQETVDIPLGSTLDSLSEALKSTTDRTEELRKQGSLNKDELKEYLGLLQQEIDLTRIVAAEKRNQAAVDAQRGGQTKAARERGAAFSESVVEQGGIDRLIRNILPQFTAEMLRSGSPVQSQDEIQKQLESLFGQAGAGSTVARSEIVRMLNLSSRGEEAAAIMKASPESRDAEKAAKEAEKQAAIDKRKAESDEKLMLRLQAEGQRNEVFSNNQVQDQQFSIDMVDEAFAQMQREIEDADRAAVDAAVLGRRGRNPRTELDVIRAMQAVANQQEAEAEAVNEIYGILRDVSSVLGMSSRTLQRRGQ